MYYVCTWNSDDYVQTLAANDAVQLACNKSTTFCWARVTVTFTICLWAYVMRFCSPCMCGGDSLGTLHWSLLSRHMVVINGKRVFFKYYISLKENFKFIYNSM